MNEKTMEIPVEVPRMNRLLDRIDDLNSLAGELLSNQRGIADMLIGGEDINVSEECVSVDRPGILSHVESEIGCLHETLVEVLRQQRRMDAVVPSTPMVSGGLMPTGVVRVGRHG